MKDEFNVAVLGGGPGGYVCAIRLAQLGKKVVLIEKDKIGGTCLNWGCIPTKALLHSAEVYQTVLEASQYGISSENVSFDYSKISDKKDSVVTTLRKGVEYLLKKVGVTVIKGEGTLINKNEIQVNSTQTIKAENIVIATGSRPSSVPIPGIENEGVLNSNDVLAMKEIPDSLVIIGGGVIGIEFATLFNSFGKKVTVIEMLPQILTGLDNEITGLITKELTKKGIEINTSSSVTKIEKDGDISCYYIKDGKELVATGKVCIVAIGRRPNTANIGLDTVNITTNKGFINVNEKMETNITNIYAIGDITGKAQLAHVASAQGLVTAHNIAKENKKMHYNVIPSCIYTKPEIACVGLDEKSAKEQGYDIKIGTASVASNGKSMIMGVKTGITKIITDKKTGEILGAQMMGPRATDIIAEICTIMKAEGTIEELEDTIHPHPTVSELIMEAAHDVSGLSVHKP